jgi:hypothetical protein
MSEKIMYRKYALFLFTLSALACGMQTLPTPEPVRNEVVWVSPTPAPTATSQPEMVEVIGDVNVRVCHATSCEGIGIAKKGVKLPLMGKAEYTNDTVNCSVWIPVEWYGQRAFVCGRYVRGG